MSDLKSIKVQIDLRIVKKRERGGAERETMRQALGASRTNKSRNNQATSYHAIPYNTIQ